MKNGQKVSKEHIFIKNGIKKYGDIQSFAQALGWDREKALKVRQTAVEIAPNGCRREGRIHNGKLK